MSNPDKYPVPNIPVESKSLPLISPTYVAIILPSAPSSSIMPSPKSATFAGALVPFLPYVSFYMSLMPVSLTTANISSTI